MVSDQIDWDMGALGERLSDHLDPLAGGSVSAGWPRLPVPNDFVRDALYRQLASMTPVA
ncbi:MAG TPA: hypothetical protein VMW80_11115 [Candidatus Dormibacteraeota bacterium]|jgi:hypothetical protein|nr:hypothetical protein [Candidatus Dormibacteraeota bacterium]